MNYSLSVKFLPSKSAKQEVYDDVDKAIRYIEDTGLEHVVGPSETTVLGTFEQLMTILEKINEIGVEQGHESFMILANFTATAYTQDIGEKIDKYNQK